MFNQRKNKFGQLYHRYIKQIYGICYSILHEKELAEDAAQECCIRIYQSLDCFYEVESLQSKALVRIIARNAAIDLYRKRKRQWEKEVELDERMASADKLQMADEIIRRLDLDGLEQYISGLSERYANALILRYYCNLSYREMGTALGITESNAQVLTSRAKLKVAKQIEEGRGPEDAEKEKK